MKRYWPLRVVLWLAMLLLMPQQGQAQDSPVNQGALVATTLADGSGFFFFDPGTGESFTRAFGNFPHHFGDFSPDGCQIIFSLERTPGNFDLFMADLDGENFRQIYDPGRLAALNYRVFEPSWSPDGSRIAFTLMRYYDPVDKDPYRRSHILWIPASGGAAEFYSTSGFEWQPRWSPDGQQLVYVSAQPLLYDLDGNPIEITEENEDEVERYPELWLVDADGNNKRRFTDLGEIGAFNPRWSSDGQRIAYQIQPFENSHRVLVNNIATGSTLALNRSLVTVLDFVWRPDGQGITAAIQGLNDVPENVLWDLAIVHHGEDEAVLLSEAGQYVDYPRYDKMGQWLAFRLSYELIVMNASDPNTVYHLGVESRHNSPPVWAPNACLSMN